MEGNIAATYTLIYRFLKRQSQNKAAEAVKKAAKQFVVLRDDIEHQGSPLEDIIKEWRSKNAKPEDADSSSEESESSDDSSSNSEENAGSSSEDTSDSEDNTSDSDDDSNDDSEEGPKVKKIPPKGAAERDTSVTLSSAEENVREATKQVVRIEKKKSTEHDSESSGSDSSDPDSSDSDKSSKSSTSDSSDAEVSPNNLDPSSSSGSSDEDERDKAPKNKQTNKSSSSSESSSDCEDESESEKEDVHVAKKRKTSESGAAAVEQVARSSQPKERPPPKVRERFQRVKVDNFAPEVLLDNGFEARGGASNDYGQRAHHDLVVTRGAGFRKEKNKKKRGSYRGGEITMETHSIKFNF